MCSEVNGKNFQVRQGLRHGDITPDRSKSIAPDFCERERSVKILLFFLYQAQQIGELIDILLVDLRHSCGIITVVIVGALQAAAQDPQVHRRRREEDVKVWRRRSIASKKKNTGH